MLSPETVGLITLAIEIVGFVGGGIVIYVMKRQIAAQAETLKTFAELNKTALAMAAAVDPKKYTDLVNTYQELKDKNTAAAMEAVERERERDWQQTQEQTQKVIELYETSLVAGLELVAYVPPERRDLAIRAMPQRMQQVYLKIAEKAPDLSCSPLKQMALDSFLRYSLTLGSALRIDAQPPLPLRSEAAGAPPPAAPPPPDAPTHLGPPPRGA